MAQLSINRRIMNELCRIHINEYYFMVETGELQCYNYG